MRTYVVAEIGVNHLCSFENGIRLFESAKAAGCDAVKLQLYRADRLAAKTSPLYWDGESKSQRDFFATLDKLSGGDFAALFRRGREMGLDVFATPFDEEAVKILVDLQVPHLKIASADLTHLKMLHLVAKTGIPIMLSTGASTIDEITWALAVLGEARARTTLLGCSLTYPCPDRSANVRQILDLQKFGLNVGWSDHTQSILTPALAVALGATVVERHFGDHALNGADNAWAADRNEMSAIVSLIRQAEELSGPWPPRKMVMPSEKPAREMARRSLASANAIRKGDRFSDANLTALRPGTGDWSARDYLAVLGRACLRDVGAGELLNREDVKI